MTPSEISVKIRNCLDTFPHLFKNLTVSQTERRSKHLIEMADYLDSGAIPNARFIEYKRTLSFLIDNGLSHINDDREWGSKPEEILSLYFNLGLSNGYTSIIPGIKKIEKLKKDYPALIDDKYVVELTARIDELRLISELGNALKEISFKRPIKTDEQRKEEEKYVPPMADKNAQTIIHDALQKITEDSYQDLVESYKKFFIGSLESALNVHALGKRITNPLHNNMISKYCNSKYDESRVYRHTLKDNYLDLIAESSNSQASITRERFIIKNLRKLASIIDNKGGLKSCTQISKNINMGSLTGVLKFEFNDGSSFQAHNSAVFTINQFGTSFYRCPLTFHNIKMMDGSKLKLKMSEKEMNTDFK